MDKLTSRFAILLIVAVAFADGIFIAKHFDEKFNGAEVADDLDLNVFTDVASGVVDDGGGGEVVSEIVIDDLNTAEAAPETPQLDDRIVIYEEVPFVMQAPYGWYDPWDYFAEEAAVHMAMQWALSSRIPDLRTSANAMEAIYEWEKANLGTYGDTDAAQTRSIFTNYYGHAGAYLTDDTSLDALKDTLHSGSLILLIVNGQILDSPYYGNPAPEHHAILLVGYEEDAEADENGNTNGFFIAHDPGTKYGDYQEYDFQKVLDSIKDSPIVIRAF
jgi:hypothetical protein